jgi:hypothetical protein
MDRKQQLEAMGRHCVQAWEGRMAAVQALPAMRNALLQDALPTYRLWLGELAQMHQGWMQVTDGGSALLDPMMPWHWLGIGMGMAVEAAADKERVLRPTSLPYPVLPPAPHPVAHASEAQNHAAFDAQGLQASSRWQKLPETAVPPPEVQQASQTPEQPALAAGLFPEKPHSEPAKQVIFRGLDDFASFVQNPNAPAQISETDSATEVADMAQNAPPKKDGLPGHQTQHEGDLDRKLGHVQSHGQDHPAAFPPLQPQVAATKPLHDAPATPSSWDQLQAALMQLQQQHEPSLQQPPKHDASPPQSDAALQRESAANPLAAEAHLQGEHPTVPALGAAKAKVNAWPQSPVQPGQEPFQIAPATHSENNLPSIVGAKSRSALPSSQPEDSLWEHLQASWAQLAASPAHFPTPVHSQHASASKALFAAAKMQPTRPLGEVSQAEPQENAIDQVTASPTPQYAAQNRVAAELPANTPEAQLPLAISAPLWPSSENPVAFTGDNNRSVAELIEAMTAQLQRDFKRYYGA